MKKTDWRRMLHSGDEVTWNDPDDGTCSRTDKILTIDYLNEDAARIMWPDGTSTELLLKELS